ncbi:caf1, partial [Symbiodinium sp. KB8]
MEEHLFPPSQLSCQVSSQVSKLERKERAAEAEAGAALFAAAAEQSPHHHDAVLTEDSQQEPPAAVKEEHGSPDPKDEGAERNGIRVLILRSPQKGGSGYIGRAASDEEAEDGSEEAAARQVFSLFNLPPNTDDLGEDIVDDAIGVITDTEFPALAAFLGLSNSEDEMPSIDKVRDRLGLASSESGPVMSVRVSSQLSWVRVAFGEFSYVGTHCGMRKLFVEEPASAIAQCPCSAHQPQLRTGPRPRASLPAAPAALSEMAPGSHNLPATVRDSPPATPTEKHITEVFNWNLDTEFNNLLAAAAGDASGGALLAIDMEFPGFLRQEPRSGARSARYQALRENVDRLRLIQLGAAVADADGTVRGAWSFNLKFDIDATSAAVTRAMSVLNLDAGLDFPRHKKEGIDPVVLGQKLANSSLVGPRAPSWVTFAGSYDLAYLLKLLTAGQPLPRDFHSFDVQLGMYYLARCVGGVLGESLFLLFSALLLTPPHHMLRLCIIASALSLCSGESLPEDVLEFNDECAEGSCALNALQHRRQPNASEEEHAYGSEEEVIQAFKGKEAVPPGSPKWIECDPLCPEMPAPSDSSDSLGAGPDEDELGSTGLWHAGANCWYRCHGAGSCSNFCGPGNSCCRWHARYDPPACRSVRWWPVIHWHTCVATAHHHSPSPPPSSSSSGSGSDSCANRGAMGDVITVYHQAKYVCSEPSTSGARQWLHRQSPGWTEHPTMGGLDEIVDGVARANLVATDFAKPWEPTTDDAGAADHQQRLLSRVCTTLAEKCPDVKNFPSGMYKYTFLAYQDSQRSDQIAVYDPADLFHVYWYVDTYNV